MLLKLFETDIEIIKSIGRRIKKDAEKNKKIMDKNTPPSVKARLIDRKGVLIRKRAFGKVIDNPTRLLPGIKHTIKRKG